MTDLIEIAATLRDSFDSFQAPEPVTHTYNPLKYAWSSTRIYLEKFGATTPREVVMIGMNPGPWGMAQTGVPFGEVSLVRDWMGVEAEVKKPKSENPKRPVDGFSCSRSEVSGRRLWTWARERYETPEAFFGRFFVWNYCPLSFMEEGGRNYIPEKLPAETRKQLFAPCDTALREMVAYLQPTYLVGVGAFAEKRIRSIVGDTYKGQIGRILHPSPASPKANRGWAEFAEQDLASLGIEV